MLDTGRNTVERTVEMMLKALSDKEYATVEVGDDRHRLRIVKTEGSLARSRFKAWMYDSRGSLLTTQISVDRVKVEPFASQAGYGIRLQADDVVSYFGPGELSVLCGLSEA